MTLLDGGHPYIGDIMFKTLIYALVSGAIAFSPSLAAAKAGGNMGSGMKGGNAPVVRQQSPGTGPSVSFKRMKILHCQQHPRGNGQGGVIMVTVCN